METKKYQGKEFIVTIRRNTAERKYVLSTLEQDGTLSDRNEPLYLEDFENHYTPSPDWPHKTIKKNSGVLLLNRD